MRQRFLCLCALILFLAFTIADVATAQTGTGIYQFGSYDALGSDTINIGNLNAHINIPVINKPGRGLPFYYNLNYDSLIWTPVTVNGTASWTLAPNAGWRGDTEIATGYLSFVTTSTYSRTGSTICTTATTRNYVYHDPFGTAHAFPTAETIYKAGTCNGMTIVNGHAVDGSGYTLQLGNAGSALVTAKDGHSFIPPQNTTSGIGTVTDSNGNQISTDGSGNFKDTLGLIALAVTGSQSSSQLFTYKDTSGTSRNVTVNYGSYSVQTAFGCSGITEYGPQSTQLVSSISFPDGSAYSFTYEPTPGVSGKVTGRLASVTLPTGGAINYAYTGSNNGISCVDGGPMKLTRTMSNDPAGSTRTYTRTLATSTSSTAVVDGLNNSLAYGFLLASVGPIETLREAYNGPSTGTAVLNRVTCYNATAQSSCQNTVPTLPVTQVDTYDVYDGLVEKGSTITYDSYGNLSSEKDYDYGSASARGPLLQQEIVTGYGATGLADEATNITYQDGNGNITQTTNLYYDQTTPSPTSGLPQHVAVSGPRGNLTSTITYINGSGYIGASSTSTYDDTGQMLSSTPVIGGATTYTYDTTYDAYLTKVTQPTVNGVTQTSQFTLDFNTGLTTSAIVNGNSTTYTYDSMLRPTVVSLPDGGITEWTYNLIGNVQSNISATTSVSVLHAGSSYITQTATLDWYGRTQKTDLSDDNGDDLVVYAYDGNSNQASVSNPYKSGSTPILTKGVYDVLGRQLSLIEPDCQGASCSTQKNAPLGNSRTITDEAGNKREIFVDGLGRTNEVLEPDSSNNLTLETDYLYSQSYSNSTNSTPSTFQMIINQKGGSTTPSSQWRTRTFTYDLLGRLVSVKTPEEGLIIYNRGLSGAYCAPDYTVICSKKDARGVVTTYAYDGLSRLTGLTYTTSGTSSAATPSITYTYDQNSFNGLTIANGVGNRTGMTDGTGSTAWSFDQMGRVKATRKTLQGVTLQSDFVYYPDGTINTLQDFGGTTLTYSYTGAGLQKGVSDQTGKSYASLGTYSAAGGLTSLTHQLTAQSPLIQRTIGYNNRLQPQTIQATVSGSFIQNLTLAYGTVGQNNGNISTITNAMDTTHGRDQTYVYDNLNRLKQGGDVAHWGEMYGYDNWGNLIQKNQTHGSGNSFSVTTQIPQNQLPSLLYDSAGNVTQDQLGNQFSYNAENRIVSVGGGTYTYDGDGNRVTKTSGGTTTLYWPSSVSGVVDESNATGTTFGRQIFLAGLRVWSEDLAGAGRFLFQDQLGSPRITTNSSGAVEDDLDYRSFGDIAANYGGAPSDNHYVFSDYESDSADSSTEYAQFRNLSSYMGRFTRPDPYLGSYDFSNPQSLNRYSYVLNRPLAFIDRLGLFVQCTDNYQDTWVETDEYDPDTGIFIDELVETVTYTGQTCTNYPDPPNANGGANTNNSGGGASGSDPCANPVLAATGVNIRQNIAQADAAVNLGASAGLLNGPIGALGGALAAYAYVVHTGGPQDVKNQPGPGTNAQRVDAGNISYGVTCPFGSAFCQFAAGLAQTLAGRPNPNGSWKTGWDTPSDNVGIRQGQAMRAAGCHA